MLVSEAIGLLAHYDSVLREKAMAALVDAGSGAVTALVAALDHPAATVRGHAALCLGRMGARTALLPLCEKVGSLEHGDDRTFCVRALVDIIGPALHDDTALGDFFAGLCRDRDHFVRALACRALGKLGNPRALPTLARAERDREPWVRDAAAMAHAELAAAVRQALAAPLQAETAAWAAKSAIAAEPESDVKSLDPVIAVNGPMPDTEAEEAARAEPASEAGDASRPLVPTSEPTITEPLAVLEPAVLAADPPRPVLTALSVASALARLWAAEATVRELAAEDLFALGAAAVPFVVAAVGERDRAPIEVLQLLGRWEAPSAVPLLLEHAQRQETSVDERIQAWRALARSCTGTEKGVLEALLAARGGDPYLRAATSAALGAFRSIRSVRALLTRLGDAHELVREEAARALGRAACGGVPDLADALRTAILKERDDGVREALLGAIAGALRAGAITPEGSAKAADELLASEKTWAKVAGLQLLAGSGRRSTEGTRALVEALQAPGRALRLLGCELAGKIAPPAYTPVIELLCTLAGDVEREVSRAAIFALAEVGGPTAANTLRTLRSDGDPEVAEAARAALPRLRADGAEIIPLR